MDDDAAARGGDGPRKADGVGRDGATGKDDVARDRRGDGAEQAQTLADGDAITGQGDGAGGVQGPRGGRDYPVARRAGADDAQVTHQGAAPSGHRGAEGDATVALADQADVTCGRANRAVGIDTEIGGSRPLSADVDLAGDRDRGEGSHETVVSTGGRRARHGRRDTTDQRSALDGQVAGGDRQGLSVKIYARRAGTTLT